MNIPIENELSYMALWASQGVLVVKNPPANIGDIGEVGSVPGLATHSSILAWRIPWTEEPRRL